MAADDIQIPMYPGEDGLTATIRIVGQDFSGLALELEVRPNGRGAPTILSTETGGLALDLPDGIVVSYGADLITSLPEGRRTTVDLFTVAGPARKKIAAGHITIGQAGNLLDASFATVEVPGIQGPEGPDGPPGPGINVIVVDHGDWPPPADPNPLNWYVRLADED